MTIAALPTVDAVARTFSRLLLADIGVDKLMEAADRNRKDPDLTVCHSHDFCDANVVMDRAFRYLTGMTTEQLSVGLKGRRTFAPGLADTVAELWSAAWKDARAADFFITAGVMTLVDYELRELLGPAHEPAFTQDWLGRGFSDLTSAEEAVEALAEVLNDEGVVASRRHRYVIARREISYVLTGDDIPKHLLEGEKA